MKKIVASLFLAGLVSAPAFAQTSPVYVGAQAGDGYIGVLAGYQIDDIWGVEGHYNKFDTPDGGFGDTDVSTFGINGVAKLPINIAKVPQLSFFATGGVERASVKMSFIGADGQMHRETVTDTEFTLGGGAQYQFTPNFRARVGVDFAGTADSLYGAVIVNF